MGHVILQQNWIRSRKQVQVARLLKAAGSEAHEIHELFTFETGEDENDYKIMLAKFREYYRQKKNVVYERHKFWYRS